MSNLSLMREFNESAISHGGQHKKTSCKATHVSGLVISVKAVLGGEFLSTEGFKAALQTAPEATATLKAEFIEGGLAQTVVGPGEAAAIMFASRWETFAPPAVAPPVTHRRKSKVESELSGLPNGDSVTV